MKLSDINPTQSMSDLDKFIVIVGGREYLITKENLQKVFSGLTLEQRNKLSKIELSGDGTKFLSDKGNYTDVVNLFDNAQFKKNQTNKIELTDHHTHKNLVDILDKFSIDENGVLLFDEETIGSYVLPVATKTILGGVKVDGNTIKINNGVISADVIGNWISGASYPVGYFVVYNNAWYQCIEANSDIEWTESKWNAIGSGNSISTIITEWTHNTDYNTNDLVIYENTIYKCSDTHTSGLKFNPENWVGLSGAKGDKGDKGNDGVSPTLSYETTDTGVTVIMVDVNNTHTFNLSNGVDGIDGKSAYEIAVDNGFEGMEQDWINSLNGKDGITPHIDTNTKHWIIGDIDTGILAEAHITITGEDGENFVTKSEFDELYNMISSVNNTLENILNGGAENNE